jgi:protein gp37
MPDETKIQWCDTTVNPIMGCGGCELFPSPGDVLDAIDQAALAIDSRINSRAIYKELVNEAYAKILEPKPGHKNVVNTTNIWHLRELFLARVGRDHGKEVEEEAEKAIRQSITCYAATLHMNKGLDLRKPDYGGHKGHAPIFEAVMQFEGRAAETAQLPDLLGQSNLKTPWKERLPRMIFVSDMGDALSTKGDFPFLKKDLMPAIWTPEGKRHLWLWLTKRPARMAQFADDIGGFPDNVCAMTTLTGPDVESLKRLADLKRVNARIRGLSIEPLWERIPPSKLNLKGIDWVIVGGESGSGLKFTRPFALEWVEELREHCKKHRVAFFLKQLGRNPSRNGEIFKLKNNHGGDWNEWDESLRVREFPQAFHDYRKNEMKPSAELRPTTEKPKKPKKPEDPTITPEDKVNYKQQHAIVKNGVKAFSEVGLALAKIKEGKLWRVGGYKTWEEYCRSVAGMSRIHAHRMIEAAGLIETFKTLPRGNVLPQTEAQVRPLLRLPETEQRLNVWSTAVEQAEGEQPSAPAVSKLVFEVLHPEGKSSKETPANRAKKRVELVARLRDGVTKRSWNDVEQLLAELEGLL